MSTLLQLLSIARDGIVSQTAALNVTGQNVAGANTPGFVRRTPVLESRPMGGVEMSGANRGFDRFTYAQLVDQQSRLSGARARASVVSDMEALVSPGMDNISDRADKLFDSFQELALHPSDLAVRSSVLANAEWLAAGFSETANGIERARGELFTRAADLADEVNQRLDGLKDIDAGIIDATGRGDGAADLRDRRDQLVLEIAERIGARSVEGADGGLTLFAAGTVLYQGGRTAQLGVSIETDGTLRIQADRDGNVINVTRGIDGGTLSGVREARDTDIPTVQTVLDTFAKDLIDKVNSIHTQGFGLDGVNGRPLFTPVASALGAAHSMVVDPSVAGRADFIGTSSTSANLPGGNDIAVLLAGMSNATLGAGGSTSERYATMASRIGVLKTTADAEERLREDTLATATALRDSASGVSTDEEMIKLQQFQRAFEASTRVLQTVNELYDSLLRAMG